MKHDLLKSKKGELQLLLTALIWGTGFTVIKYCVSNINIYWFAALRYLVAVPILLFIFKKHIKKINMMILKNGIIQGILMCLAFMLQVAGCAYTTTGKNAFLCSIYVVIIPFICLIVKRTKISHNCFVAIIICIIGIGFLSGGNLKGLNKGDILSILSGFAWSANIFFQGEISNKSDPEPLIIVQMVTALIITFTLAKIMAPFPEMITAPVWGGIFYNAIFGVIIGFMLQNLGQRTALPSIAGIILSLEAVFGSIFSAIFLGERMTVTMFIGSTLIFIAVVISNIPASKKTKKKILCRR